MPAWNKKVLDREELKKLYVEQRLSLAKIGQIYNCDAGVILRNMREFVIPSRTLSEATTKIPVTKDQLIQWYWKEKLSMFDIANKLRCTHSAIVYKFQKLGIKSRGNLGLTPPVRLTKETLEYFYNNGLSLKKIAKVLHRSRGGVERKFRKFGLTSRENSNRACKYKKFDFSGNLKEKAYMIGFRLGDLNVRRRVSVIQVRCSTTHKAQVKLIKKMFSPYTTPHSWEAKRGTIEIVCLVNGSFEFLLAKEDCVPGWVLDEGFLFWAFFAGYADAEGSMVLLKSNGVRIKKTFSFSLTSYDLGILTTLAKVLLGFGVNSRLYMSAPKGTLVKSALARQKIYYSNEDAWRLDVAQKQSLWILIQYWKQYSRHGEKIQRLKLAERNLVNRNSLDGRGIKKINLDIPEINTHLRPFQGLKQKSFLPSPVAL